MHPYACVMTDDDELFAAAVRMLNTDFGMIVSRAGDAADLLEDVISGRVKALIVDVDTETCPFVGRPLEPHGIVQYVRATFNGRCIPVALVARDTDLDEEVLRAAWEADASVCGSNPDLGTLSAAIREVLEHGRAGVAA